MNAGALSATFRQPPSRWRGARARPDAPARQPGAPQAASGCRYPVEDHELHSREYAARLRGVRSRDPGDPDARELISALLQHSPEFTQLWEEHEVALPAEAHKRIAHPTIGLIELDCLILTADNQTEKLVIFTATPGSEHAERLALLRVIGTEQFTTLAEVDATSGH